MHTFINIICIRYKNKIFHRVKDLNKIKIKEKEINISPLILSILANLLICLVKN